MTNPFVLFVAGVGAAVLSISKLIDAWEEASDVVATRGWGRGGLLSHLGKNVNIPEWSLFQGDPRRKGGFAPGSTPKPSTQGHLEWDYAGSGTQIWRSHDLAGGAAAARAAQELEDAGKVIFGGLDEAGEKAKEAAKAWQKELDKLSGREAIKVAEEWRKKVDQIGGVTRLAAKDQKAFADALWDSVEAMTRGSRVMDVKQLREDLALWAGLQKAEFSTGLRGEKDRFGITQQVPQTHLIDQMGQATLDNALLVAQLRARVQSTVGTLGQIGHQGPELMLNPLDLITDLSPGTQQNIRDQPSAGFFAQLAPWLEQMQGVGPDWMQSAMVHGMNAVNLLAGGKWKELSAMQKVGGLAQGAMGLAGLFGQEYTSTGSQVGSGAMQGLQAGAMFGPWGAAIGAGVGALVGLISGLMKSHGERAMAEIGKEWGVQITQATAEAIEADMKNVFGGQANARWAAEVFNLGKIIQDAGGVTDDNFASLAFQARQAFVFLDEGQMTAQQVAKVLDESFGSFVTHMEEGTGLAKQGMLELIHLSKQAGVESKAVMEFLEQQAGKTSGGFNAIAQNFTGLGFSSEQLAGEEPPSGMTSFLGANLSNVGVLAQAAFATLIASGQSVVEALAAMTPGLDTVAALLELSGIAAPAAFGDILQLQGIVQQHKELFTTLGGVDEMLKGLHNSGMLTQESFAALSGMATQAFDTLTAGGVASEQALRLMQPQLQTIWALANDFGFAVDAGTQALLDQAQAQGIVGEQMKPIQEQMLGAMTDIKDVLIIVAETLGATIPDHLKNLPGHAQAAASGVQAAFDGIKGPNLPTMTRDEALAWNENRPPPAMSPMQVPGMAAGGIVRSRRGGTLVNVGEGGRDEAIVPLARVSAMGGASRELMLSIDGDVFARVVLPLIVREAQRLGVS